MHNLNYASIFLFTLVTGNVLLGLSNINRTSITDTIPSFEIVSHNLPVFPVYLIMMQKRTCTSVLPLSVQLLKKLP